MAKIERFHNLYHYPEKLIQKVDNCGSDFIRLRKAKFKMKTNFIANILPSAKAFIYWEVP